MGKKPLNFKQVKTLRQILADKKLDSLLLNLGIDSMLRASDLLQLKIKDVVFESGKIKDSIKVIQKKTSRSTIELPLSDHSKKCIDQYLKNLPQQQFIFLGNKSHYTNKPITIQQYARIIKSWMIELGCENINDYSTHSVRKVKPTQIWSKTNNIEAIRRLLGHKTVAATSSYLGVSDQDATNLAKQISV